MTDLLSWLRSALDDADLYLKDAFVPAYCRNAVAAHREILDRHSPDEAWIPPGCRACSQSEWGVDWPCDDIRSLAAIYRESHPGFDPSWIGESDGR